MLNHSNGEKTEGVSHKPQTKSKGEPTYLDQIRELLDRILIVVPNRIAEINFKDDIEKSKLLHLFHADGNGFLVRNLFFGD